MLIIYREVFKTGIAKKRSLISIMALRVYRQKIRYLSTNEEVEQRRYSGVTDRLNEWRVQSTFANRIDWSTFTTPLITSCLTAAIRLPVRRIDFTNDESSGPMRIVSICKHLLPFVSRFKSDEDSCFTAYMPLDFRWFTPFHALRNRKGDFRWTIRHLP